MNILITGGAGYIGSHTIIELIKNNHSVAVIDNLVNSSREALRRVEEITNTTIPFYEIDLRDFDELRGVFAENSIDAVIHFAGLKSVGESVSDPLRYYRTNLDSTLALLSVMSEHNVKQLVFSSSATVYGSSPIPYSEQGQAGINITSPYGKTKYMIEQILQDWSNANPEVIATSLRYFNPIGAHESGRIGEDPQGIPNNLMPFISQVAVGSREELRVFGGDYPTPDGTCIRDYIHVSDVSRGHLAALMQRRTGHTVYNLGSGKGVSVLELIEAFERSTGKTIHYKIVERRSGDIPAFYADATKALQELGWKTEKTIEDACSDSWLWQSSNPKGYAK